MEIWHCTNANNLAEIFNDSFANRGWISGNFYSLSYIITLYFFTSQIHFFRIKHLCAMNWLSNVLKILVDYYLHLWYRYLQHFLLKLHSNIWMKWLEWWPSQSNDCQNGLALFRHQDYFSWIYISSGNGFLPEGTKVLCEPMLSNLVAFTWGQYHKKCSMTSVENYKFKIRVTSPRDNREYKDYVYREMLVQEYLKN